ncbi:MAG: hypothetical protein ACYS8Z_16410 [Planctomycetota bacterium]|jgi:hypothetical protein
MASDIRNKLEEFREVLAASGAVGSLLPGLSRDEVEERLSRLPFEISADAIELYTWADGPFYDSVEILPGGYLIGLEQTITSFEKLAPMQDELDSIFPQQYRDCLRFLHDLSDGGYAFGRVDSPSEGKIIDLCIHDEWRLAFESLDKLLDTAIECRRRGVFRENDEICDFNLFYSIGRELNPGMETWE